VLDGAAALIEVVLRDRATALIYHPRSGDLRARIRLGAARILAERAGIVVLGYGAHVPCSTESPHPWMLPSQLEHQGEVEHSRCVSGFEPRKHLESLLSSSECHCGRNCTQSDRSPPLSARRNSPG
jgi:hypothetical protein